MAILPRPRQRKRTPATGDKREAILEVAGRLFFTQGYAQTGVEQIALELGTGWMSEAVPPVTVPG